jgi:type IV pilus assembly protein PilV
MTRQKGFTLVETLVALVVLSIGLLGVAALQLTALQNNGSAVLRSQATYLTYDIADRMRANHDRAVAKAYDVKFGATPGNTSPAEKDLTAWKTAVAATLPAGDCEIESEGTQGQVIIRIRWDDSKGVEAPLTFETRTRI